MAQGVAAKRRSAVNIPMLVRQLHSYFSVFIAPSVLFFAFTGLVQIYSLHEAHGTYRPAPLVEKLAAVHKDQVFEAKAHKPAPTASDRRSQSDHPPPPQTRMGVTLLKADFAIVAVGLIVTTLLGLWMALRQNRRRAISLALFVAGIIVPMATFLFA